MNVPDLVDLPKSRTECLGQTSVHRYVKHLMTLWDLFGNQQLRGPGRQRTEGVAEKNIGYGECETQPYQPAGGVHFKYGRKTRVLSPIYSMGSWWRWPVVLHGYLWGWSRSERVGAV